MFDEKQNHAITEKCTLKQWKRNGYGIGGFSNDKESKLYILTYDINKDMQIVKFDQGRKEPA